MEVRIIILAKLDMLVLFAVIVITIKHKVQKHILILSFGDARSAILIRN